MYGKAPAGLDENLSLNKVNWNVFGHCTKVGFEAYIVSLFGVLGRGGAGRGAVVGEGVWRTACLALCRL